MGLWLSGRAPPSHGGCRQFDSDQAHNDHAGDLKARRWPYKPDERVRLPTPALRSGRQTGKANGFRLRASGFDSQPEYREGTARLPSLSRPRVDGATMEVCWRTRNNSRGEPGAGRYRLKSQSVCSVRCHSDEHLWVWRNRQTRTTLKVVSLRVRLPLPTPGVLARARPARMSGNRASWSFL